MHEPTFRGVTAEGGLNPFYFQMANIREQVSWVTQDPEQATKKAKALISAAVRRVALHDPLARKEVPVRPEVLIVGGGIAGIHAALTYANSGKKVYLVEKQPSIGGHMSFLDKTFPTLDCSACILTPKMSEVGKHPNIELLTWSEVEEISGFVGNFKAKIRKKARYVDIDKCNGCGACWENCPTTITPSERIIRKGDIIIKKLEREQS
jgi:heterodisulfide reductase subunit A